MRTREREEGEAQSEGDAKLRYGLATLGLTTLCCFFTLLSRLGVIDDISLMWRCFVEAWTHEEVESGSVETIWSTKCTRRKRVVQSEEADNRKILEQFYDGQTRASKRATRDTSGRRAHRQ